MANYIIYDTLENALARADEQGKLMNYSFWVNGVGTRYHTYPTETNNNKTLPKTRCNYSCYLLKSETSNRTYIGITTNLKKRLRQHNGEICGGAKYTRSYRPWKPVCLVYGFKDNSHALCFEWRVKRKQVNNKFKTVYLKNNRIKNFFEVLQLERFTKKCDLSSNYNFKKCF
mgnify:CR=1 FL=1